jgi:RNA polymerase sigma-70 factor, ECF subfamily
VLALPILAERGRTGRDDPTGAMQRELVLRAREGDHDAFSELAAGSIERLLALARLIVRDHDRAQDAVQDALVNAWLDIRGLRDPDRFDAWLHRLLVRSCYRTSRRDRRRGSFELPLLPVERDHAPDSQQALVIRDQIDRGFRRLPVDQRAVLVLHHYLSLPDREAADILDIPIGTVKSRLNRATAALRAALEAEDRAGTVGQESLV